MADWWYYGAHNGKQVGPLWECEQIINNIRPLNEAIANMSLSEAVQYIADKLDNGSPVGNLIVKFAENFKDSEETETDTYVIGSVHQGGGGRSGGGGAGRRGYASDAWREYASDALGGYVSVFGNAAETEEAIPYLVLLTKGNILSLGVQLFLPQSAAIAALLPYAGLATTEEFWQDSAEQALEIGTTLLEYTFKGIPIKGLVPVIMDSNKQLWIDASFVKKLKAFTKRWREITITNNPLSIPGLPPLHVSTTTDAFVVGTFPQSDGRGIFILGYKILSGNALTSITISLDYNGLPYPEIHQASELGFTAGWHFSYGYNSAEDAVRAYEADDELITHVAPSITYNGKTFFTLHSGGGNFPNGISSFESNIRTTNINHNLSLYSRQIAWTMLYAERITDLPDGIYSVTEYDYTGEAPSVLKNSSTLELRPLAPVVLPSAQPYITSPLSPGTPSSDNAIAPFFWPSVNQDEFVPYDPDEYPAMAYDPESATAPLPTPQNVPETQPIENPSSPGVPDISYDPSILDPPISGGISPIIGVPDPLNWPSIVTTDTSAEHNGDPGLIHVYNPSNTEMQNFGRWLWVTYNDTTLIKIFNNPFDGVIGAHELYATPASVGVKEKIRSGFLVSDVDAYPVLVRYININCGSIVIPEYWGNYLDYAPYTKVFVYLPFIGIVELEADDIIGHSVNINYAVDTYTGACIAQITVAKDDYVNTLYEFQGNCAVEVPITGGSQAAIKAGLITAAAYGISGVIGSVGGAVSGVLGGLASTKNVAGGIVGGVMGGLSGLGETAANAINNVVSLKSSVQHSGTFGSSFGAMGIKKPYIIVKRPIQKVVPGYNQDYGYPAHKQVVIGQCQGYLKVLEINVVSPTATNDEKAQIEALLKQGVYVS